MAREEQIENGAEPKLKPQSSLRTLSGAGTGVGIASEPKLGDHTNATARKTVGMYVRLFGAAGGRGVRGQW